VGKEHLRALVPLWRGPRSAPCSSYLRNAPQAGSVRLCKAPRCPVLSPYLVRVELLTRLSTCCMPRSPAFQGPRVALGSVGSSRQVPAADQRRRSPFGAGQGVRSCWDQLKAGQTLGGAEELEIFPTPSLAWVLVGFGHKRTFLNGKPLAVVPWALHLQRAETFSQRWGPKEDRRAASHPTWSRLWTSRAAAAGGRFAEILIPWAKAESRAEGCVPAGGRRKMPRAGWSCRGPAEAPAPLQSPATSNVTIYRSRDTRHLPRAAVTR